MSRYRNQVVLLFAISLLVAVATSATAAAASLLAGPRLLAANDAEAATAAAESPTYRAAVVELATILAHAGRNYTREEALAVINANFDDVDKLMAQAAQEHGKLDIVVLNEYALYGPAFAHRDLIVPFLEVIPSVGGASARPNPCLDQALAEAAPILARGSCLARKHRSVLVVNMGELQGNPTDPARKQYNTDVVFDEDGNLIAKYHKTHLYYEPFFDAGGGEPVVFDTSFGVRFGVLICFDIMHGTPQMSYLHDLGVRDFVFSSWWVNFPSAINGLQTWQGWSMHMRTNLLAASSGHSWKSSGSGVFSSGRALASYYNPEYKKTNSILVADVPKQASPAPKHVHRSQRARTTAQPSTVTIASKVPSNDRASLDMDIFEASSVQGKLVSLRANTSAIGCEAEVVVDPDQIIANRTYFALSALSGQLFPVLTGQVCQVFLCGTNRDDCEGVARGDKARVASDVRLASFSIVATSLTDPEVRFLPFVSVDKMQLVDSELFKYDYAPGRSGTSRKGAAAMLRSREDFYKLVKEGTVAVSLFGRNFKDD